MTFRRERRGETTTYESGRAGKKYDHGEDRGCSWNHRYVDAIIGC
jgi:hypothetical protein